MSTPISMVFFGIPYGGFGIQQTVPILEAICERTFPQIAANPLFSKVDCMTT